MGLGVTSSVSTKWPLFQDSEEIVLLKPSASLLVMEQQILGKVQHTTMRTGCRRMPLKPRNILIKIL